MSKILVVDDDLKLAEGICRSLQAGGYDTICLNRGEPVVETAKAAAVDLLILDVMLPGSVCGFEVCRRVRADAELFTLPVLILSAMGGEEEVSHGLAQGADDYVTKPFSMPNLASRIEALLRAKNDIAILDDLTALPSAVATKRELQRRISRQDAFSLLCSELLGLREFARTCGPQARIQAIRVFAEALRQCERALCPADFVLGHMGGGYFVGLLPPDDVEKYCHHVVETWKQTLPKLFDTLHIGSAVRQGARELPMLTPLICVTTKHRETTIDSQGLFEVITRLRHKALEENKPGVYFDRRG